MSERVQNAIRQARGNWAVLVVDSHDVPDGWEPFAAEAGRVWVRRRERDWGAAVVLVAIVIGAIVVARWLLVLLIAWLVVA